MYCELLTWILPNGRVYISSNATEICGLKYMVLLQQKLFNNLSIVTGKEGSESIICIEICYIGYTILNLSSI